jgi:hypothetical protein
MEHSAMSEQQLPDKTKEQTTGETALAKPPQPDETDLKTGLLDFYSAQADLVLTQYKNINFLLGETNDWTAPGTYCEVLLRDLLRKSFPAFLSFDKGFVHGRRQVGENSQHCPEIDILAHDTHNYRPIFRMEDFVIVQPEAVRGIIQVKRTMNSSVLETALKNVVEAKQHIRDCGRSVDLSKVYSAVVTFGDNIKDREDGSVSQTYGNQLAKFYTEEKDRFTLPIFVGSLTTRFCGFNSSRPTQVTYRVYPSVYGGMNVGLQVLLASMTSALIAPGFRPRFSIPKGLRRVDEITLQLGTGE